MSISLTIPSNTPRISAPASKSYLQRALAIAALTKGTTTLENVSWCNDTLAANKIIEDLNARVFDEGANVRIQSEAVRFNRNHFTAGESGLCIRMFSPVLALSGQPIVFTGEGSLLNRPVELISEAMEQLGVMVQSNGGLLPITIHGKLKPGSVCIDGSLSSQLLTGLLIVLPLLRGNSTIVVDNLKSKPYVDMTLSVMRHFGIEITHENYKVFHIKGDQQYKPAVYAVEGDWSSAAFFLVAGAVKNGITVTNLNSNSLQADKEVLTALKRAGANILTDNHSVTVLKGGLNAFEFDATHCPDLFPPLSCLASQCNGTSTLKGVSRLTHKESNRAETIQKEFSKMGVPVYLSGDIMKIEGATLKGATVDSHNDHRIAMAGAVMNLFKDEGEIEIVNAQAVKKSYPGFFDDLKDYTDR